MMRTLFKRNPNKKESPRKSLIFHIHSINKVLTYPHLNSLSDDELLTLSHPLYREQYREQFGKDNEPVKKVKYGKRSGNSPENQ